MRRVATQFRCLFSGPAPGAGWIGGEEETPAGYLLAVYVFSLEQLGLTAEIDELFVVPSTRGRGIGGERLAATVADTRCDRPTNFSIKRCAAPD